LTLFTLNTLILSKKQYIFLRKDWYLSPAMTNNFIPALREQLSSPKNIVVIPHKNPDGDALGVA